MSINRLQLSPSVLEKLDSLINRAKEIEKNAPDDYDENGVIIDFWGDNTKTKAQSAISFFRDSITERATRLSENLVEAIEQQVPQLPDHPLEAFDIANQPKSPMRNMMIRNEIDLLD